MSVFLQNQEADLPLLSKHEAKEEVENVEMEDNIKKAVRLVFLLWSIAAILCLALLSVSGAWVDILANTRSLRDDMNVAISVADLKESFAWGPPVTSNPYAAEFRTRYKPSRGVSTSQAKLRTGVSGPSRSVANPNDFSNEEGKETSEYFELKITAPSHPEGKFQMKEPALNGNDEISDENIDSIHDHATKDTLSTGTMSTAAFLHLKYNEDYAYHGHDSRVTANYLEPYHEEDSPPSTLMLDETNWEEIHRGGKPVFVDFYAPWCVWCQRLAPTWERFAEAANGLDLQIAKVDCVASADLCRRERIMAFPTLRWYVDGQKVGPNYKQDRTVQSFLQFANAHMSESYPDGGDEMHSDSFLERTNAREAVSEDQEVPEKGDAAAATTAREVDGNDDSLVLDLSTIDKYFSVEVQDEAEVQLSVQTLTAHNWDRIHAMHTSVFVNFYAPWCHWSQRLLPTWNDFDKAVKSSSLPALVASVDCVVDPELCAKEGIQAFPTLRWYENGSRVGRDYTCERSVSALMKFSQAHLAGAIDQYFEAKEKEVNVGDNYVGFSDSEDYPRELPLVQEDMEVWRFELDEEEELADDSEDNPEFAAARDEEVLHSNSYHGLGEEEIFEETAPFNEDSDEGI